jgi:hypothetical protein
MTLIVIYLIKNKYNVIIAIGTFLDFISSKVEDFNGRNNTSF